MSPPAPVPPPGRHARRLARERRLGAGVGLVLLALPAWLLLDDDVRATAARVGREAVAAFAPVGALDRTFEVADATRVDPGQPVFHPTPEGGDARPVGHVLRVRSGPGAPAIVVRFATEADAARPKRLVVVPAGRRLSTALQLVVPPAEARRFGDLVAARAAALWREEVGPAARARLPAFLARLDPTVEGPTRTLLDGLGAEAAMRLEPLLDDLVGHVTGEMERRFDVLDRLGLLVKFIGGDGRGLARDVLPVAKQAAAEWWGRRRNDVFSALGAAFAAREDAVRTWVVDEVLSAALDELVDPLWAEGRARLEAEAEALLEEAAATFVESPDGGFRVRFSGMLRHVLLGKERPLLLLE